MSLLDWSAIQIDILQEISSHAADDADYVRFRSVCTSWRSAAPKRPQIPWLAVNYHDDIANIGLGFCNFPHEEAYPSPVLPEGLSLGKLTVGCSRGWIVLIDNIPGISLHNPFTGAHIRLPLLADSPLGMEHFHAYKINAFRLAYKVVLSSDPREDECVIMALSDGELNLIFCRPGDASWTRLPPVRELYGRFSDIQFYNKKFYIACNYRVFAWDPMTDVPRVTEILPADPLFSDGKIRVGIGDFIEDRRDCIYKSFLVVSSGDLLLVGIMCPHSVFDCYGDDCDDCAEYKFEVFRIDFVFTGTSKEKMKMRFVKQESLGGRSLFVGKKSMSVSASVGNSTRCKGNCIYLSMSVSVEVDDSDVWPGGRMYLYGDNYGIKTEEVIIVFNMEDGSISSNFVFSTDRKDARACHWLTPSLC